MNNYLCFNNEKIELTSKQVEEIKRSLGVGTVKLSDIPEADTFKIGEYEFIVLEQNAGRTNVILKDLITEKTEFGKNNNFDGSNVDDICSKFSDKISKLIGEDNLILHSVDLTSDDGLKDYGVIERKMSFLTAEMYRKYVNTLDKYKLDKYWWLATPHSTPSHCDYNWVKCVSPFGSIGNISYNDNDGVRPFCILKSDIFVSK